MHEFVDDDDANVNIPGTGPQTRGIISNMAEHDVSSKHNWRAEIQLNVATAGSPCVPAGEIRWIECMPLK